MGKYDRTGRVDIDIDRTDDIPEASKIILLRAIANEIAEANRLKRYQLKQKYGIHRYDCDTSRECECLKPFEDQA